MDIRFRKPIVREVKFLNWKFQHGFRDIYFVISLSEKRELDISSGLYQGLVRDLFIGCWV